MRLLMVLLVLAALTLTAESANAERFPIPSHVGQIQNLSASGHTGSTRAWAYWQDDRGLMFATHNHFDTGKNYWRETVLTSQQTTSFEVVNIRTSHGDLFIGSWQTPTGVQAIAGLGCSSCGRLGVKWQQIATFDIGMYPKVSFDIDRVFQTYMLPDSSKACHQVTTDLTWIPC